MMNSTPRESAKIYDFPTRVRTNSSAPRAEAAVVVNLREPALPAIVFGSGWYHEEAIEEARRAAKH